MLRRSLLAAILFVALAADRAEAAVLSTFDFQGTCGDCTGFGDAQLTLTDYALGALITTSNFVSFTYAGTNLLDPFTIDASDVVRVGGEISPPLPGAETFSVSGQDGSIFSSSSTGFWCAGSGCDLDVGFAHVWSAASAASVPEPGSVVLFAGAVIGVIALRRRPSGEFKLRRKPALLPPPWPTTHPS